MRYDSEHKQRTHEKVLSEAASALRQSGPDKMAIAGLMAKAGLTHGGFYAHFSSKEALIAETIGYMFDEQRHAFQQRVLTAGPQTGFHQYIDRYLSLRHRDHREKGCPMAALSGDLARMSARARKQFEDGIQRHIEAIAQTLTLLNVAQPALLATAVMAEMVGAITLARAVSHPELSAQILDAARISIKNQLGLPAVNPDSQTNPE